MVSALPNLCDTRYLSCFWKHWNGYLLILQLQMITFVCVCCSCILFLYFSVLLYSNGLHGAFITGGSFSVCYDYSVITNILFELSKLYYLG